MKKKTLLILIPILLCVLTGCKNSNILDINDSSKNIENNNDIKANIYQYLIDKNYLDEPNLEEFEITNITKKGYYKSNSNVVYLELNCTYKCKEDDSCILNNNAIEKQAKWLFESDDDYYFFLEYDLKNEKVLGKRGSYGKDSDFKQVVD